MFVFFFFQAEDGIRDHCVTGVQTCALSICKTVKPTISEEEVDRLARRLGVGRAEFVELYLEATQEGNDNPWQTRDRKSTRLNSSHTVISYAVFCLKKKKTAMRDL